MRYVFYILFFQFTTILSYPSNLLWADQPREPSSTSTNANNPKNELTLFPNDASTRAMVKQHELTDNARNLAKQGLHDEAIAKYQEALHPSLLGSPDDTALPLWGMSSIHKLQGKYEEALNDNSQLLILNPKKQEYLDKQYEILALIKFKETNDPQPVYDHIQYLKSFYKNLLPPKDYNSYSSMIISAIIRLYDTIGDHNAGIGLIDELLDYLYRQHPGLNRVKTSEEAYRYVTERGKKTPHRLDWLDYDRLWEHLKIREAFEKDKTEGKKGRATRALIQSDYFPW